MTAATTSRPATAHSTPRLSEVARHLVIPTGIVSTGWPAVEAQLREFGEQFDRWQQGFGQVCLGKRADGLYAATIGGIIVSIPRQVAKTYMVGRIVFALCVLFPGLKVLWTAHRTRTATNTFKSLQGFARRKAVSRHVKSIRVGNGEQEIEFTNGSRIMFGAREQGFGRGFDEVDVEVFDEAQILTEKALEDMVAATNQSRHPHGALLFYMGTPPRPGVDPGEVFTARRDEALAGDSRDMVYIETSADPDCGKKGGPSLDDREQLRKANPSYPHRTPEASIARLRKNLPSDDSWRREALGIWPERGALVPPVIDPAVWDELKTDPPTGDQVAYGVRFSPDGARVALAAALADGEGAFVEVLDFGSPVAAMDSMVAWLTARWRGCDAIVIDGRGAADVLEERLLKAGVNRRRIVRATLAQASAAYAGLLDRVTSGRVTHAGQPGLRASIACSKRRDIGRQGAWGYEPNHPDGESIRTEAAALAISGLKAKRSRTDGEKRGRAVFA